MAGGRQEGKEGGMYRGRKNGGMGGGRKTKIMLSGSQRKELLKEWIERFGWIVGFVSRLLERKRRE